MSTIVTRSGKGSPLTHVEVDANFNNLNTDKYQEGSAIGSTTPAAGTFTTLKVNGTGGATGLTLGQDASSSVNSARLFLDSSSGTVSMLNAGGNTFGFATAATIGAATGSTQMRISHTASAVNYVQVTGAATGGGVTISAQGSDTNVSLTLRSKGSNEVTLGNGNTFRIFSALGASGTNYPQTTSSATGQGVQFSVQGSDTNISQVFQSKGTGAIDLAAGSSGVNISNGGTVTAITRTAAGLGYTSVPTVNITAPTTAGGVQAVISIPSIVLASPALSAGGTGYTVGDVLTLVGGTFTTAATVTVTSVSGGVITAVSISNNGVYTVAPTTPISVTGGTGTGATFNSSFGINSNFTITNAGSGYVEQPTVSFSGGGGSGAAAYARIGGDTAVKGLGTNLDFYTPNSSSVPAFRISDIASADSYYRSYAPAGGVNLIAQGATNANATFGANGTGSIFFTTNGTSLTSQFRVAHTASAVNYVQVTGAATGGTSNITFTGSDANVLGAIQTKGTGSLSFYNNGGANRQVRIDGASAAVNYLDLYGAVASSAPSVRVGGSDTNIDLTLTPKGTGAVVVSTSLNTPNTFGFKNRIINSQLLINQRAVSGTVTLSAGVYGHDRFKAGASGCTYTFATSNNVTTLTISAGSLIQVIEGLNLESGTYTLSWTGTAQGKIGAGSYSASGITGSITGGTNTNIEFNTGTLSLPQLEKGSTATSFDYRPYGTELALCQRYYYRLKAGSSYANAGIGRAYATTNGQAIVAMPVSMRAAPTGGYSALSDWNAAQASGNITAMSPAAQYSLDYRQMTIDITATMISGQSVILNANNTTNAWIDWSAEL